MSFCVINGCRYESFDDQKLFGDTGTSHNMDIHMNYIMQKTLKKKLVGMVMNHKLQLGKERRIIRFHLVMGLQQS